MIFFEKFRNFSRQLAQFFSLARNYRDPRSTSSLSCGDLNKLVMRNIGLRKLLFPAAFWLLCLYFPPPGAAWAKPLPSLDKISADWGDTIDPQSFGIQEFKSFDLVFYTRSCAVLALVIGAIWRMRRRQAEPCPIEPASERRHSSKPRVALGIRASESTPTAIAPSGDLHDALASRRALSVAVDPNGKGARSNGASALFPALTDRIGVDV